MLYLIYQEELLHPHFNRIDKKDIYSSGWLFNRLALCRVSLGGGWVALFKYSTSQGGVSFMDKVHMGVPLVLILNT